METLPNDWLALLGLMFPLGPKHGLDADQVVGSGGLPSRLFSCQVGRPRRWRVLLAALPGCSAPNGHPPSASRVAAPAGKSNLKFYLRKEVT